MITTSPKISATAAYTVMPPGADEFSSDQDSLEWESEGWEEIDRGEARFDGTPFELPTNVALS
jgi:hypothetical protein